MADQSIWHAGVRPNQSRLPDELAWTTDGCPACDAAHAARGCAAVLPVALLDAHGDTVELVYRCGCGHDWTSWWDRGLAAGHATVTRDEAGMHWPRLTDPSRT